MQPAWVAGWLQDTCDRVSAKTAAMMLINLSLAIEAMVPDQPWRWIRKLPGRPSPQAVRASANRKPKPEIPDTMAMAADALDICRGLMTGAPSIKAAVRFRDALLVAFACYHAPRLRNLAEIRIGIHLVRGGGGIWQLRFEGTKNGRPLTPRLGQSLVAYLEHYLQVYRPLLLRGKVDHGFLWVNRRGLPLASTAFRGVFRVMGVRLVGYAVYPNIVRHGMATGLLSRNPRSLTVAAAALAHRSTASVNTVYDKSGRAAAAAEWHRVLGKWMQR
jgi:integrase